MTHTELIEELKTIRETLRTLDDQIADVLREAKDGLEEDE